MNARVVWAFEEERHFADGGEFIDSMDFVGEERREELLFYSAGTGRRLWCAPFQTETFQEIDV